MASNDKRIPHCARFGYMAVAAFCAASGAAAMPAYDELPEADKKDWELDAERALLGYGADSVHANRHIGKPGAVHFDKAAEPERRKVTLFIEAARSLANALGAGDGRVQHITVKVEGAQVAASEAAALAVGSG